MISVNKVKNTVNKIYKRQETGQQLYYLINKLQKVFTNITVGFTVFVFPLIKSSLCCPSTF